MQDSWFQQTVVGHLVSGLGFQVAHLWSKSFSSKVPSPGGVSACAHQAHNIFLCGGGSTILARIFSGQGTHGSDEAGVVHFIAIEANFCTSFHHRCCSSDLTSQGLAAMWLICVPMIALPSNFIVRKSWISIFRTIYGIFRATILNWIILKKATSAIFLTNGVRQSFSPIKTAL